MGTNPLPPDGSKSWNIYRSCRDLPMNRFIEISKDGNFSLLDRKCNNEEYVSPVPPGVLLDAWGEINLEYTELMDNGKLKRLLLNGIDTEVKRANLEIVAGLVKVLTDQYDEGLVKVLKGYGFDYEFDYKDEKAYYKDLTKVTAQSKTWLVQILTNEKELDEAAQSNKAGNTRETDWTELFFAITNHFKIPMIEPEKITVYGFIVQYKNFIKDLTQRSKSKKINVV